MKLSELKCGQSAIILSIDCKESIEKRLSALGLSINEKIKIIRKAPFNSPIEIYVKDFYLALRKNVCDKINVKICSGED